MPPEDLDFEERTTDPGVPLDDFAEEDTEVIQRAPLPAPAPPSSPPPQGHAVTVKLTYTPDPVTQVKLDPTKDPVTIWERMRERRERRITFGLTTLTALAAFYTIAPTSMSQGRTKATRLWEKVDHSLRIKFDPQEVSWREEMVQYASGQKPIEELQAPAFLRNWEWLGCGVDEDVILTGVNELDEEVEYLRNLEGTKKDQAEVMLHNDDFEQYRQIDKQNSLFYLVSNSKFVFRRGGSCQARAKKVIYIWTSLYPEDAKYMYLDSRTWVDDNGKGTAHVAVYIDAAAFEEIEPGRKWYVMDGEHLKATSIRPSNPKPVKRALIDMTIGIDAQPEYFCGASTPYRMVAPPKNGVQRNIFDPDIMWSNVMALSEKPDDADKVLPNMNAELYACYEFTYQLTKTSRTEWIAFTQGQDAELQLLSDNMREPVTAEALYDNLIAGRDVRCGIKAALPLHHIVFGECGYYDELGNPGIIKQFQCEMGYTDQPFTTNFHWGKREECGVETTSIVKSFLFQETTSDSRLNEAFR